MTRKHSLFTIAGATVSLCLLTTLTGCGGGGGGSSSSNSGGTQTTNYAEAVTLADGQTGALSLTTSGSTATGTLALGAATGNARPRVASPHVTGATILPGVYPVTGTLSGGTFTLTGTISGTAFTLTATPPSGSATGNFSLATGGTTYTGTIATAPTGSSADTSIAGTYQLVSLANPTTSQTVTCPGSLAFGSGSDTCGASEITALNANGTYTITIGGTTASTGSYTLIGNILTTTGKELEASGNGQTVTALSSVAKSGNTLTTTLLSSTASDQLAQAQAGEVFTYTQTSTGGTSGGSGTGHILFSASAGSGSQATAGATDMYRMNPDGTGVQELTHLAADNISNVTYSPDRSKVMFTVDNGENDKQQIYAMNSDGSSLTNFTGRTGGDAVGSFSPDGSKVVFSSNRDNANPANFDLYVANADGSSVLRLTTVSDVKIYGYFTRSGVIVYGDANGDYQINADGTGNSQIGTAELTSLAAQYQPWTAFSPDGTKLVSEQTPNGEGGLDVFITNADGSSPQQETHLNFQSAGQTPTFSPDGSKVVFDAEPAGTNITNSDIYVVGITGSGLQGLTNTPNTFEIAPVWVQ